MINKDISTIRRDGWRPYFEFDNLKSSQIKKGRRAMNVNLRENLHDEKVRNLGANEKQRAANQRLR
tara:strand:- start:228 stop:425 length:198 start_codon:yes stop_codon:yes gene_type:complete